MNRAEKRPLDGQDENGLPEEKRQKVPTLASVIVEAVKLDSLQKLCSTLEPLLRRVVGEEVERALAKLAPQAAPGRLAARPSPKQIVGSSGKQFRLQFKSKLALPLFTGSKVEGEGGSAIHVVLQDASTGQVLTNGVEANVKVEVVVLEGDFAAEDEGDWTQDEFEQQVVRERDGKRPLLAGDLTVTLKEGVGTLGDLTFTDNSSWIRSRKFRLGVRLIPSQLEGVRVREAKTEAFTVKDHRGELYKKHYPPALHDEVWRLDRIGKDGAFHKRLNQAGIFSVEDFLRLVVMDPQKLRNILGSGMSNKMWEGTVEHAKTCVLNGKLHVYYADDKQNIGVIFNNIFQLMGLIADGQYMSVDLLSESEKIYVDKLVKVAYENWENVVEYDGEALIGVKPYNLRGLTAVTEDPGAPAGAAHSRSRPDPGDGGTSEPASQPGLSRDFFGTSQSTSQNPNERIMSAPMQANPTQAGTSGSASISLAQAQDVMAQQEPLMQLALGRSGGEGSHGTPAPVHNASGNPSALPELGSGSGAGGDMDFWSRPLRLIAQEDMSKGGALGSISDDDLLLTEEDLRAKSWEMLVDNEDMHRQMQQLLGLLGDTDDAGFDIPDDPQMLLGLHEPRESGSKRKKTPQEKASVGWLKLKAALRWSIFVRKRAAQRRARLEEVEEQEESNRE